MEWQGKRYWLVGASEGLGEALAHVMSCAGVELVLSARNKDKLEAIVKELPGAARAVACDVGDRVSVEAARTEAGDLDGVIILAGVYWPQSAQEWNPDEIEMMCDVNFTGTARVVGSVVKDFAARDAGHIVITGSLSGFRGLPGAQGYAASKAGVMAMAESLYCDFHRTNVRVQLSNPGFIKTRLTDKNDFSMPFIMSPEDAAREMFEHMCSGRFDQSFPRFFSWVFRLSRFMPNWMYYRLFA
ncbi:MAG: SDR family NAD(P)-dependent oxidoreductase [Marinovum sp.]|nr:SDR family NAD(P)-dependent oxidoreductase [Marinovum sp.]